MKLKKSFFEHDVVTEVARDLIGKKLCTKINQEYCSGIIVETEAYSHLEKACHAFLSRRTQRTDTLFMEGGTNYVYLCYGIHKLFNIVTNKEGTAEAVLIRAVEPVEGVEVMMKRRGASKLDANLTSGPGKLTQAMGIDLTHNKTDLDSDEIWIEPGEKFTNDMIETSPRIGVSYALEDALLPWRYTLKNNKWVSKGNNKYDFKLNS